MDNHYRSDPTAQKTRKTPRSPGPEELQRRPPWHLFQDPRSLEQAEVPRLPSEKVRGFDRWEFQEPKLEISPENMVGLLERYGKYMVIYMVYTENMAKNMVRLRTPIYPHFRILKIPLILWGKIWISQRDIGGMK